MSTFVNTLPYISNPVEEFKDYKFVSREENIYPDIASWPFPESEIDFFCDIIKEKKIKNILDLWLWLWEQFTCILKQLKKENYILEKAEANEVNISFIENAEKRFIKENLEVLVHKWNRVDLPDSSNPYATESFDLAFLAWDSLTYVWWWSRLYTKLAQKSIINKFAALIKPGGYLFIDTRDYDYIKSLMMLHPEEIIKAYSFEKKVHFHDNNKLTIFPAYISDAVVVLHYYNHHHKIWWKQEYYPIYHNDIVETLSDKFEIEQVYYDYEVTPKQKCILRQYLARKK